MTMPMMRIGRVRMEMIGFHMRMDMAVPDFRRVFGGSRAGRVAMCMLMMWITVVVRMRVNQRRMMMYVAVRLRYGQTCARQHDGKRRGETPGDGLLQDQPG